MGSNWTNKAPSFSKVIIHKKRWRSCQCQWSITLLEVLLPLKDLDKWKKRNTSSIFPPIHKGKNVHCTVEPRFNEGLKGGFVISRFFSIHFTVTGADGSLGTLNTDNGNSNGNGDGNAVKETGKITRFGLTDIANYEQLISSAKTANSILLVRKAFFSIFVSSLEGGQDITISSRWLTCVAGAGYFFKGRAREHAKRKAPPLLFSPRASSRFLPSP